MHKPLLCAVLSLLLLLGPACPALAASPAATAAPTETEPPETGTAETIDMVLTIGDGAYTFTAALAENSSAQALLEKLAEGPVTISMRDYGNMEKVGGFGFTLPRNDEPTVTRPGDLILYQGNAFVIYYAPNSWDFTPLGAINSVTAEELTEALGGGDVTVTLSLPEEPPTE